MKPISIRVVSSILFAAFVVCACRPVEGQDWARKMFKEYIHDFGNVQKGEVPEYRFTIENIYEEDIHIAWVRSSCGCTSVSLTKNILKTWEKGEIVCRFNSPAFDGFKQATVTVRFDRPFVGEVQLTVQGNIVRGLNISPKSIDFGQLTDQNLTPKTITLAHTGTPNFRIVDVKSTFPHIKVSLRETMRRGGLVNYEMTSQLRESVPHGFTQGELYVVVEENQMRREVPVKFSAKVVSPLQLPATITLGTVKQGEQAKKRVVLKADRPFKITDVTCQSQAFRVKADREAKKVHFIEVIYDASEAPGKYENELNFYTDLDVESSGKMKAVVEVEAPVVETGDTASNR